MGQKLNIREKEYSALNVHIAPFEINNLILATCYIDTYANQSLYTNLVNNFARHGVSVYVSLTLGLWWEVSDLSSVRDRYNQIVLNY